MKILTLATVVLLGTSLAACSGSDSEGGGSGSDSSAYCKDVAKAKPVFEDLATGDLSKLEEGLNTFHRLADEAPSDLKDDWRSLDDAATSIEKALKESGLKFSDLPAVQQGQIPPGVDVTKLTTFAADLQKLNTSAFDEARAAIAKQAKDTCNVKLGAI
ncbi:hypothetical protein [Aeromicrobium wangtongii]|uniref:hypothetical protein n=1 Tax=Aeromicrobium wangtongii TaxID=2969247 RepID=UPI002017CE77|nr:hypothetical protein [Aeromicrobium wangtongii]MCL3819088.1 hypothetical protein [Aeromicrobium wangtongii]